MKKSFLTFSVILLVSLGACSNKDDESAQDDNNQKIVEKQDNQTSELTLQSFIDAFEKEGIDVDSNEKPMFSLIKAKDGIIFYIDGDPVKIYEYENEEDFKKGVEALPDIGNWEKNGRFLLETTSEKAKEIFNNVK